MASALRDRGPALVLVVMPGPFVRHFMCSHIEVAMGVVEMTLDQEAAKAGRCDCSESHAKTITASLSNCIIYWA